MWLGMTSKESLVTKFGLKLFIHHLQFWENQGIFEVIKIPEKDTYTHPAVNQMKTNLIYLPKKWGRVTCRPSCTSHMGWCPLLWHPKLSGSGGSLHVVERGGNNVCWSTICILKAPRLAYFQISILVPRLEWSSMKYRCSDPEKSFLIWKKKPVLPSDAAFWEIIFHHSVRWQLIVSCQLEPETKDAKESTAPPVGEGWSRKAVTIEKKSARLFFY